MRQSEIVEAPPRCRRCQTLMVELVRISPTLDRPARTNWRGTGDETQLMFPGELVLPLPLRERFIGDTVMSIDVFGAINPTIRG
jgi:hypothetical protein